MDEIQLKKLFGKRIRELRIKQNLTQEKLSELLWIDPQHFCKMENGNHFPTAKNLVNLANVLAVDIKDLFSFEQPFKNDTLLQISQKLRKLNQKELLFFNEILTSYSKINESD